MHEQRLVVSGMGVDGAEYLFALAFRPAENQLEIDTYATAHLTPEQVQGLYQQWQPGHPYTLPVPTEHSAHPLDPEGSLPIYARLDKPELATRAARRAYEASLSLAYRAPIEAELQRLQAQLQVQSQYSKSAWETLKHLQKQVHQAFTRPQPPQVLSEADADTLKGMIQNLFEQLNALRSAEQAEREARSQEVFPLLEARLQALQAQLKLAGTRWKHLREEVRSLQQDIFAAPLGRAHRDLLIPAAKTLYQEVQKRLDASIQDLRSRQVQSQQSLEPLLVRFEELARDSQDWKLAWQVQKELKEGLFPAVLDKAIKDAWIERYKQAVEQLASRHTAYTEAFNRDSLGTFAGLSQEVTTVIEELLAVADGELKAAQQQVRDWKHKVLNTSPMTREQRGQLLDQLQAAYVALQARLDEWYAQRRAENEQRTRDRVVRLEGVLDTLKAALVKDTAYIDELYLKIRRVKPGPGEGQARGLLQEKIKQVQQDNLAKQAKIADIQKTLQALR
jgi:hypothetical protein